MSDPSASKMHLDKSNVWVAPDPISSPDMLCAGTLLYFDAPIVLTIPPQVITPESFELLQRIKNEKSDWAARLFGVLSAWENKKEGTNNVLKILEPLAKDAFYTMWFVYNSNDEAIARAKELISSAGWTSERFLSIVDVESACGELVRHLFLEKYLELNRNLDELYKYIASVFAQDDFSEILASAYALRLLALVGQGKGKIPIALTNPHLANFLADLPGPKIEDSAGESLFEKDAVSMMVFNGLLSKWIDPLTERNVEILATLRRSKRAEIDRLKGKCLTVAENMDRNSDAKVLFDEVDRKIRFSVLPEVRDLLEIGNAAFRDYKEKLLGDRVFWTGFIGTIVSSLSGAELVSAGAAVSTLASMGATAFSHYREIRQTVKKSDYSLIYTVANMAKR